MTGHRLLGAVGRRLLLTGEIPTKAQVDSLTREFHERSDLPAHVVSMLHSLPTDMHPMTQFSMGILACQVTHSSRDRASREPERASNSPRLLTRRPAPCLALSLSLSCFCLPVSVCLCVCLSLSVCVYVCCGCPQTESRFAKAYAGGVPKTTLWEYAFEDVMDVMAKVMHGLFGRQKVC